jgi:hypothetical protein
MKSPQSGLGYDPETLEFILKTNCFYYLELYQTSDLVVLTPFNASGDIHLMGIYSDGFLNQRK